MSLIVEDTIPLWTPAGTYEIQLLYGDITRLSVKDMVDIIMVSAFPGDYSSIAGTVLGALKGNLGISTRDLARTKELDLRKQFMCWISKPLPDDCPYRRLLCFERSSRGKNVENSLVSQIRDMFRVFVPVFNNRETTVITPLLATGNQGHGRAEVLGTMLECAASWIQGGLPLKCLKIVIYGHNHDSTLTNVFTKVKDKYMALNQKQENIQKTSVQWDVFITYEPEDKLWATQIEGTLKSTKDNLKIFTAHQDIDENKVWQDQIFKLMSSSQRIIVVLTPSFIKNPDCLEQFNMAMCCGRMRKSNILLPFYVITAETMPVYMSLVQYYDCRIRKENDKVETKIQEACTILVDHLHEEKQSIMDGDKSASVLDKKQETKFDYDVFISYSHKNPQEAQTVLKILSEKNPDIKIFFDREELKMGSMWQKSLYHSLDTAKCVIALMSPTYLSSMVCQEEYNIALLRQLTSPNQVLFIPICIGDLATLPPGFGEVKMLDARGDNFMNAVITMSDAVVDWLKSGKQTKFHGAASDVKFKKDVFQKYRTSNLPKVYSIDKSSETISRKDPLDFEERDVSLGIALCYAGDTLYCPRMFQKIIENKISNVEIHLISTQNAKSLHDLDNSDQIVVFLSPQFVETEDCLHTLHMALCRQRSAKGKRILHIVQTDDIIGCPQFIKLLHIGVCFKDQVWTNYEQKVNPSKKEQKIVKSVKGDMLGSFFCRFSDYFALTKTVDDVLDAIHMNMMNQERETVPNLVNVIQLQKHFNGQGKEPVEIRFIKNDIPKNQEKISPHNETKKSLGETDSEIPQTVEKDESLTRAESTEVVESKRDNSLQKKNSANNDGENSTADKKIEDERTKDVECEKDVSSQKKHSAQNDGKIPAADKKIEDERTEDIVCKKSDTSQKNSAVENEKLVSTTDVECKEDDSSSQKNAVDNIGKNFTAVKITDKTTVSKTDAVECNEEDSSSKKCSAQNNGKDSVAEKKTENEKTVAKKDDSSGKKSSSCDLL